MRRLRQRGAPYALMLPALLLMAVFVYLPILTNIRFSVHRWSFLSPDWTFVGADNYRRLLADPLFWAAMYNNFLYAAISLLVQVGLGKFPAAEIKTMLAHRDRRVAGMTAPAHGLVLWKVFYSTQSRKGAKPPRQART